MRIFEKEMPFDLGGRRQKVKENLLRLAKKERRSNDIFKAGNLKRGS
jgi:hypothetical protein